VTAYLLERALLPDGIHDEVLVEIEGTRFTSVTPLRQSLHFSGVATPEKCRNHRLTGETCTRLPGLTIPGLANAHSHAFHRGLRGRTQTGRGSFWTWRDQMYAAAERLDPDSYLALATAVYREMAAAGMTTVGEFHYLHHGPDGRPYADPNAMGEALIEAATAAGIRIALLDACYLAAGFGRPPEGTQVRFSDGDADRWAERVARLAPRDHAVIGAAVHSVRAVPAEQIATVAAAAAGRPLHVHLSEQRAENEACLAAHGVTPTRLLAERGALGPDTTAVHATHLTDGDVAALGSTGTHVCFCPTTERDLGDGTGPSRALHAAGARLTLGSDSQAVVDPFEEMRAVELDERLAGETRGHWSAGELIAAATRHGSLGFPDAGRIEAGARADLVTLDTGTPRTAGTGRDEHTVVFAATAADVVRTVADGRVVFERGDEPDIGAALERTISALHDRG